MIRDRDRWIHDAVDFVTHVGFKSGHSSVVDEVIDPSLHRQHNEGVMASNAGTLGCRRLIPMLDELRGFHEAFAPIDLEPESPEVEGLFVSLRNESERQQRHYVRSRPARSG